MENVLQIFCTVSTTDKDANANLKRGKRFPRFPLSQHKSVKCPRKDKVPRQVMLYQELPLHTHTHTELLKASLVHLIPPLFIERKENWTQMVFSQPVTCPLISIYVISPSFFAVYNAHFLTISTTPFTFSFYFSVL